MTRNRYTALASAFSTPKGGVAGVYLLLLIGGALLAPWLAPYADSQQNLAIMNQQPSATHLLGTDELGRDVLSRVIFGARTSLTVSSTAIGLSLLLGLSLGAACGYFGGILDRIVMVGVDLTWSFPEILIALMLVAVAGPGLGGVVCAVAIAYLAQFTRLTRTQVISLTGETYIEATRNLGATHFRILFSHLLPNVLAPVLVAAILATGDAIILEATFGFFGLGAQPPTPSWGAMMSSGTAQLFIAPWVILFPGFAVAMTVIFLNLFGDALIGALDVRSKSKGA
ncbi:ABC transporter permease [Mesorhizobium australicum]|uniref:ABC transporter permease n=1 Tax=Mesorhizobium australicum TaxID=536018 RepID=UPI00333556AE